MSEESAVPALLPAPQPRYRTHARLRSLQCFDMIHELLVRGVPLAALAEIIQEDWSEALDRAKNTLIKQLSLYRKEIPSEDRLAVVAPQQYERITTEAEERFDTLTEYYKLYRLQEERVGFEVTIERKYKKAIKTTHKEVREQRMILRDIRDLELEVGRIRRSSPHAPQAPVSEATLADLSGRFGFDLEKVTGDPKSRQRVLVALDRFRLIMDKTGDPLDGAAPEYSILDKESAIGMMEVIDVSPEDD